ncbi:MAG: hypothetical protein IIZ23_02155 [Ruminococcus sp.]|nr:hypothetical protein [Ruminococcus sp.]
MAENKKLFVEKLGSLIKRQTREGRAIKSIYYAVSLTTEYVVIERYAGSAYTQRINVTGNNCITIMHELFRALV